MAGTLPGVELARRRRTHHHESWREPWVVRPRMEPTTAVLDETALRARARLEQKLRGSASSSRWSQSQYSNWGGSKKEASDIKNETHENVVRRETGRCEDVCAVCLDEFRVQQRVMNLPCSHRYHSDCLRPWLNVQSHCPCCRTHVLS